ncbi:MAG: DNA recombination protein RmuC [Actinomycetota bacterium]|jgi:DNA recombination protein RmuC|tara:strand:- start:14464 stop:15621 length:1158 start_codon:yes stop_codon:yes gene_type:complete
MDVILGVIIGLLVGGPIGFLVKSSRPNSDSSDNPLIKDLKEQLEREKSSTAAATKMGEELSLMKKTVEKLTEAAGSADLRRVRAETEITEQVKSMAAHNESLVKQTRAIAGALASSQTRGKFGEAHLEKLLESAGLIENEHFTRQSASAKIGDSGAIPDVTINMPGGSVIYIDSKFPFQRFYEAFETEDDLIRKELLVEHSKDLLAHIQALSKRNYAERGPSPDFVILYAPIDAIFIEAVKAIPDFLETSFRLGVTIATPTSMMALLRTVGYLFSRNRVAANAEEIQSLAVKFLRDVSSLHEKIVTVGERLKSTLKAYNEMIPTAETTVLSAAKKMKALDVSGKPLKALPEVSENLRILESKLALDAPEDFIEVEEVDEVDEDER